MRKKISPPVPDVKNLRRAIAIRLAQNRDTVQVSPRKQPIV
jgi:hypothetical protein